MADETFTWRGIEFKRTEPDEDWHSEFWEWRVFEDYGTWLASREDSSVDESGDTPVDALENLREALIDHHRAELAALEGMPNA